MKRLNVSKFMDHAQKPIRKSTAAKLDKETKKVKEATHFRIS